MKGKRQNGPHDHTKCNRHFDGLCNRRGVAVGGSRNEYGPRRRVDTSVDGLFARAQLKRDGNWLADPYVGGTEAKIDKKRSQ